MVITGTHPTKEQAKYAKTREDIVNLYGGKCQGCGVRNSPRMLILHHKEGTVEGGRPRRKPMNEVKDDPSAFWVLCPDCHNQVHREERERKCPYGVKGGSVPERGYTIKEVALRLGLAEKTVRKMIKDGRLRADKVNGPRGPQYTIWLSDDTLPSPQAKVPSGVEGVPPSLPVEIDPRLEALLSLPERIDRLDGTLASMLETMEKAQKERADGVASDLRSVLRCVQEQAGEIAALKEELRRARLPIWKRIFRRL